MGSPNGDLFLTVKEPLEAGNLHWSWVVLEYDQRTLLLAGKTETSPFNVLRFRKMNAQFYAGLDGKTLRVRGAIPPALENIARA